MAIISKLKTISISKSNLDYIRTKRINFSKFVRDCINKIDIDSDNNFMHIKTGVNLTLYDLARLEEIRKTSPKFNLSRFISEEIVRLRYEDKKTKKIEKMLDDMYEEYKRKEEVK